MNQHTLDEARAAKTLALTVFSPLVKVVGIGITMIDGGYGLKINVQEPPAPELFLPIAVDGVPVRIEVVGVVKAREF
jgi:hypothetical protein